MNTAGRIPRRCAWVNDNPLLIAYHDQEWGVPVHDDQKLFELLILEGAQAGLAWQTVLNKRENYRHALSGFDPVKIARYSNKDVNRLLGNPGIIRHRLKIAAAIINANKFLEIQKEFEFFDKYIWQFVDSVAMSKDLRKRGFKFAGSTICYAFMQAVGMVNDHTADCFRYAR